MRSNSMLAYNLTLAMQSFKRAPTLYFLIMLTLSIGVGVLCVVLGVMVLAVFFTLLSRISIGNASPETISVRGVLKKNTWATVKMTGSETFDRVRFIGFTNTESMKTHLPYDLNGMVILEDEQKRRFLVRAKAIRMIIVEPDDDSRDNEDNGA